MPQINAVKALWKLSITLGSWVQAACFTGFLYLASCLYHETTIILPVLPAVREWLSPYKQMGGW